MKKIEIKDRFGNIIGSFRYDPSCPALYRARARAAHDVFDREAFFALFQISIRPDGTAASPAYTPVLEKAERTVYNWFDTFLGYDGAGHSIFRTVRPFASVGGEFFARRVMRQVAETVTQSPPETIWGEITKLFRRKQK